MIGSSFEMNTRKYTSMNIGTIENVYYEHNSTSKFDDLNEKYFLDRFFTELQIICPKFALYNFYIYTTQKPDLYPTSFYSQNTGKDILLFLSDELGKVPLELKDRYKCIFKPYLMHDFENIYTFPLGYVGESVSTEYISVEKRCYDVFFSGNFNLNRVDFYREVADTGRWIPNNHLFYWIYKKIFFRLPIDYFLKKDDCFQKSKIRFTENFKGGFPISEYIRILSQSKIVLCPRGFHSTECFRHYEALKQGCIVISEKLPDSYLYDNSPIIQIDNWKGIRKIVNDLLQDESLLMKKSEESLRWYENVMSEKATAMYVLSKIEQ